MSDFQDIAPVQIHTIYLIDDSDDEAFLAQRLIKRANIQVAIKAFVSPAEFLDHVKSDADFHEQSSLVIVDLYLELEMGTEVISQFSALYPKLIVGMSTGSEDPRDRHRALESGACFFSGKPLDRSCFESICTQVLSLDFVETDDGVSMFRRMDLPPLP